MKDVFFFSRPRYCKKMRRITPHPLVVAVLASAVFLVAAKTALAESAATDVPYFLRRTLSFAPGDANPPASADKAFAVIAKAATRDAVAQVVVTAHAAPGEGFDARRALAEQRLDKVRKRLIESHGLSPDSLRLDLDVANRDPLKAHPDAVELSVRGVWREAIHHNRVGNPVVVPFDLEKNAVNPDHDDIKKSLLAKIKNLDAAQGRSLLVEGHADSQGSPAGIERYSRKRAELVRDFLVKRLNATADKIEILASGADRPIASNDEEEGRIKNRRVEVWTVQTSDSTRERRLKAWLDPKAQTSVFYGDKPVKQRAFNPQVASLVGAGATQVRYSPSLDAEIERTAKLLTEDPKLKVRVEVHIDQGASPEDDMAFTAVKAEALRKRLLERSGVKPSRVLAAPKGSTDPMSGGDDSAKSRARDQRVIFQPAD